MLVIIVILIGLIKNKKKLIYIAIGVLYIISTPIFSNNFFKLVEGSEYRKPLSAIDSADAIVVLSGMLEINEVGDSTYLEWGDPDRFFGGITLFKAGKAQRLIFTGGKMPWDKAKKTEGEILKEYAISNGIKDTNPLKTINIDQLVELIKNNPKKDIIKSIHSLKSIGDSYYKVLKEKLPHITPNSIVRAKKLSGNYFNENFISFSNYIYFDIDTDIENYKEHIINTYGNQISLVCNSSSGGGISILVKVSNQLTQENFKLVWSHIRNTILQNEPIDEQCCNIARSWFIPYDEELYFNPFNSIEIDFKNIIPIKSKNANQYIKSLTSYSGYTPFCTNFKLQDIKEVYKILKMQSTTTVTNEILDFNPVYVCKIFIPKIIPNTRKHKTYKTIIHNLAYLNPGVDPIYIFSFIYFINMHYAAPSMEYEKLLKFFQFVYGHIISTETIKPTLKLKRIHFNTTCEYNSDTKNTIANKLNGIYKRKVKIDQILDAKEELKSLKLPVTTKAVANLTGIKLRSVQLYYNCERIDFDNEVLKINMGIS